MIVPFRTREHGQDEYVVCPEAPATVAELRERMLGRAKVAEGSFAFRLVDELHADIFRRSLDLKADYLAYFAREYDAFGTFMRRRTRFPAFLVDAIAAVYKQSSGIYHFRPAQAFLSEGYGLEFLSHLLEEPTSGGGT